MVSMYSENIRTKATLLVGRSLFASPTFIASTLPARESHYFREFLSETDPDKRDKILDVVSPEMRRALSAQWTAQKARIAVAEGRDPGPVGEGGRQYDESLAEYEGTKTDLDYANWLRSKEIADFFSRTRSFRPVAQQNPAHARAKPQCRVRVMLCKADRYLPRPRL